MNRKDWSVVLLALAVLIGVMLFISPVNRTPLEPGSGNSGISGWEYMPGEDRPGEVTSAYFEGLEDSEGWMAVEELREAMAAADIFWLRGKLPEETSVYSPALFLEFDFPVEVFVDGRRIYSYGTIEEVDRVLAFQHIIPIKDQYRGKTIYFRYPARNGLTVEELRYLTAWDMVSESEKTTELANSQLIPLFLCAMGVFLGTCLMAVAVPQKLNKRAEAGLLANAGGFVALTSINIINSLYAVSLALDRPVITFYMDYISYFLIPYSAGSFLVSLLETAPKAQMRIINRIFLLFLASVLMLSRLPGFDISRSDYVFNTMFLAYSIFMMSLLFKEFRSGNRDVKIIIAGLMFIGLTGVIDILSLLNIAKQSSGVTHIGIFALSLCMVAFFALRYQRLFDDVRAVNTQLVRSKKTIEDINRDLDRKVVEKTAAIRSLFDNAEQGFLSFRADLSVESEYSFKCRKIFGCDISGRSMPDLLSGGDSEQKEYVQAILESVFDPGDEVKRAAYFSLLPGELSISGRLVSLDFKMIDRNNEGPEPACMVILTDITERKCLETRLEQEQSILKMCVAVVANHTDFVNTVTDYIDFCNGRLAEILGSSLPVEGKYTELFRLVHTFKGTFAYFEMKNIAVRLHELETEIYRLGQEGFGLEPLKNLLSASMPRGWLREDFEILRDVLGERYLRLDKLVVAEESKLREIEDRLLSAFEGEEARKLVKDIRRLRYRSLKDMLGHYPGYCLRLAERLEKHIEGFEIQGPDIEVDPDVYSELCKSMVHIFRNLADHGIESPGERVNSGKPEAGSITCSIGLKGDRIEITAADDGAGIDIEETREIAVAKGLIAAGEAAAASGEEILQLLFTGGFTTVREVTELSGRGVGLSAVKEEVMKLKGSIEVRSRKGAGTSYHISVPLLE
ncbi:MAG TPA: ATP-binding protein [Clostridia bacterium]|nr:ATP-binding protein [Clostridia bacterium]